MIRKLTRVACLLATMFALQAKAGEVKPESVADAVAADRLLSSVTVTLLAKPTARGEVIHAVVLDYGEPLLAGDRLEAAFEVEVFLGERSLGMRQVHRAHAADMPSDGGQLSHGRYLILNLNEGDPNASPYVIQTENDEPMTFRARGEKGSVVQISKKQVYKVPHYHGEALRYVVRQRRHLRTESGELLPVATHIGTGATMRHGRLDAFRFAYHPSLEAREGYLGYHLYEPRKKVKNPYLVVALHGSGQAGPDTVGPLVSSRLAVATLDLEEGYVLVPQYDGVFDEADASGGIHWQTPNRRRLVLSLIDQVLSVHPEIDRDRIYLNGLSRGAEGALYLMQDRPAFFAGALLMSGREANTVEWIDGQASQDSLRPLSRQPIWFFHAAEDKVAPVEGSRINYHILKEELGNPNVRYTELSFGKAGDDGMLNDSAHNSWDMVYNSPAVLGWLLKQRRQP